ncbi:MAG: septum formation initiator family protein [Actinobacteria bacterium]|nr:septum formation initiator family protein [Actinomycetota bacterium]
MSKRDDREREQRRRQRRLRRIGLVAAALVLVVGAVVVAGSPWRSVRAQQAEAAAADAELAALKAEQAEVEREYQLATTDAEIERQAREAGMVKPGEEAFSTVPVPVDPAGLPPVWPFTGVEQALGAG